MSITKDLIHLLLSRYKHGRNAAISNFVLLPYTTAQQNSVSRETFTLT